MARHGVDFDRNGGGYSQSGNADLRDLSNGRRYQGEVLSIDGFVIPENQLWKALVDLENIDGKLVPGPRTRILNYYYGLPISVEPSN